MRKYAYIIIIFVVGSLILELLLTLAFMYKDRHLVPLNVRDHPYLYYSFKSGENLNEDGFKTNSNIHKAQGTYRIILTGGSVARSAGPLENSIASFLEKILNRALTGKNIEIVNAGVSGYVVQQEFLLTQMVLQKYNADMIISLSGFNDVFTIHRNNFSPTFDIAPPHNWKNFKVIEMNRFKKSVLYRLAGIYKSFFRIYHYYKFNSGADVDPDYEKLSSIYWNTTDDIADLTSAKGIRYFHFVQPARDLGEEKIFGDERLNVLFENIISRTNSIDYAFDLSNVFENRKKHFTDYCHLDVEGNEILAEEMAKILLPLINHDPEFFELAKAQKN
ncbi:MAG: SGNH/GDSL hydrolase family protein [Bacteroidia bacterium]|nr:SGNH/GDSL hydrolase family protein [Bacteroidia bacterium]